MGGLTLFSKDLKKKKKKKSTTEQGNCARSPLAHQGDGYYLQLEQPLRCQEHCWQITHSYSWSGRDELKSELEHQC